MVRKEVLDEIGGFNEDGFMYLDDIDLCYRIRRGGWKNYFYGESEIIHYAASSSRKRSEPFFSTILIKEAVYAFMRIYYGRSDALRYRLAVAFTSIEKIIVSAFLVFLYPGGNLLGYQIGEQNAKQCIRTLRWALNLEKWVHEL